MEETESFAAIEIDSQVLVEESQTSTSTPIEQFQRRRIQNSHTGAIPKLKQHFRFERLRTH